MLEILRAFVCLPGVSRASALRLAQGRSAPHELLHIHQLHVEDQGCVGRNYPRITLGSVGQVWRNAQLALATYLHAGDTFVPALDDLAGAQHELKRFAGPDRAVELLAVGEPAGVIDFDVLSGLRDRTGANLDVPVFEAAGGLGGLAGDLGGTAGGWFRRCLRSGSRLGDGQAGQRE